MEELKKKNYFWCFSDYYFRIRNQYFWCDDFSISAGNICVYCPGGPDSDFEYSTQSYTGYEPTSMRAIRARYDPYEQTRARVDQVRDFPSICFANWCAKLDFANSRYLFPLLRDLIEKFLSHTDFQECPKYFQNFFGFFAFLFLKSFKVSVQFINSSKNYLENFTKFPTTCFF